MHCFGLLQMTGSACPFGGEVVGSSCGRRGCHGHHVENTDDQKCKDVVRNMKVDAQIIQF